MFYLTSKTVSIKKLAKNILEHLLNIDLEKQIAYPIKKYCNLVDLNVISLYRNVDFMQLSVEINNICRNSELIIEIPEKYSDYNFLIKKKIPLKKLDIICGNGIRTITRDLVINIVYNKYYNHLAIDNTECRTIYYDLVGIFNLKNKYEGNISIKDLTLFNIIGWSPALVVFLITFSSYTLTTRYFIQIGIFVTKHTLFFVLITISFSSCDK